MHSFLMELNCFAFALLVDVKKMKKIVLLFLLVCSTVFGQRKSIEELGFKHIVFKYKSDTVDILVKSKKGEEHKPKPLFLFCQGSLPQPLIKYDEQGYYGVFPFSTDSLEQYFHLVIISKPYIPLVADVKSLKSDMSFVEPSTGKFPKKYSELNYLDYYVERNSAIIQFLQNQKFVSKEKLVVAGHSEGSTIAAKLALKNKKVTHIIYASGNPLGRIQTIINQHRSKESDTDSTRFAEFDFEYWNEVVKKQK